MRVLNLYAGVGGNRAKWQGVSVTAVENEPEIASVYRELYPADTVLVEDAHQYLLDHHDEFDFIWSSPPCQTHSRMAKATRHELRRYPDLRLYEEILFLQANATCRWVVENVVPYYESLIPAKRVGRHLFWSNFWITAKDVPMPSDFINRCDLAGKRMMQDWLGIHFNRSVYYGGNHCPAQVLRNCVHPLLGKRILECAMAPEPRQQDLVFKLEAVA